MKLVFLAWLTGLLPFLAMAQPVARIFKQQKGCEVIFVSNISELSGDVSLVTMCDMAETDTVTVYFGPFKEAGTISVTIYEDYAFKYYGNGNLTQYHAVYIYGKMKKSRFINISFTIIPNKA